MPAGQSTKVTADRRTGEQGIYGHDLFRASLHQYIKSHKPPLKLQQPPNDEPASRSSSVTSVADVIKSRDSSMVVAVDKVTEAVVIAPTPAYTQTSVYSQLQFADYKRYREEVHLKPLLSPVKYSDTHYLYINSTRKRFVSRTFYEPRVKARGFAETTFTCPKTKQENFVSYLDHNVDAQRKWFKTAVEIKARRFRSAQVIPAPIDINSNSLTAVDQTRLEQQRLNFPNDSSSERGNGGVENGVGERFQEIFDPGASQVFIPKRRETVDGQQALLNGGIVLDFPNGGVDLQHRNGHLLDFSDV
ncbi:uncharacterized protein LOC101864020 isoform X2 [Aplysia californica]|uniref:Uncharacterized protein LOC101864020 isoform X2 n=1 Tax=Aplysia californica TaxID=6500 RepID=A0ABM0K533_APLCA|nr:uncharacterized protein LOC101864020 isoform X2 [Aplysia californica]